MYEISAYSYWVLISVMFNFVNLSGSKIELVLTCFRCNHVGKEVKLLQETHVFFLSSCRHDSGRSDGNYTNILQDSSMNYRQETRVDYPQIHKNWSSNNFSEDSSVNSFKQANQTFPLEHHQQFNSVTSSSDCVTTCQGLSAGFPLNSTSYSYTSSLLQTLFDTDSQPQQSLLDNQAMNYSSAATDTLNSDEFLASLAKVSPAEDPSFTRQQPTNHLPFTNNAPLWKATAGLSTVPTNFLPSAQSGQFPPSSLNIKIPNLPSFSQKVYLA